MRATLMKVAKIAFYMSIGLYSVSLTQPCYCTELGCGEQFGGLAILITGGLGAFMFPAGFTWFANVTLILSWINHKKPKTCLITSIITFCLALSFLFFDEVMINEAGGMSTVTKYQLGYWLWLASTFVIVISSGVSYYRFEQSNDKVLIKPFEKLKSDETMITGQWIYSNGKMHSDGSCERIDWLVSNYLTKTDTKNGGWTTIYKDSEDGRYWVRTFPHGEMHGGGPPLLYCIGHNSDFLYKGMTVNERLYISGQLGAFDSAVKQNDVATVISILEVVELTGGSIDPILEFHRLKRE